MFEFASIVQRETRKRNAPDLEQGPLLCRLLLQASCLSPQLQSQRRWTSMPPTLTMNSCAGCAESALAVDQLHTPGKMAVMIVTCVCIVNVLDTEKSYVWTSSWVDLRSKK